MEVKPVRQKPVRNIPSPIIPLPLSTDDETPNKIDQEVGERIVVQTKTSRLIDDDSSGTEEGSMIPGKSYVPVHVFEQISLKNAESSSDESDPPPPKISRSPRFTKTRKKHKSKTEIPEEITKTIGEITSTVTDTFGDVGRSAVIRIVKTVIKSRQFTIILLIASVFIGIGYLLKIVYK